MTSVSTSRVLFAAASAMLLFTSMPALGQNNNRSQASRFASNRPGPKVAAFDGVNQGPPSLPYMPFVTPGSCKYRMGLKNSKQTVKGANTLLSLRYSTTEHPQSLLKAYTDSLKDSKWKILSSTQNMMQATYKGNTCTVILVPPSGAGYTTDFQLNYQFAKEQQ